MSLSALPAVLVQSIMQSLHAKEIIALARCCKWTLQCADSIFAWRDCPPLTLQWVDNARFPPPVSPLARFIPLAIRSKWLPLHDSDLDRLLVLAQSCPRIVSLGWEEWRLSVARGLQLLSHPAMRSVRDLGIRTKMQSAWLPTVASLPSLTELDIADTPHFEPEVMQSIVHARALRRLLVSDSANEQCVPVIMQMSQLRMLCVHAPRIDGSNFLAFCSAMSGLEELWLQSWQQVRVRSITPSDLAAGFAALRSLHTLCFDNTFDEQTLPPVLHLPPSLRTLSVPSYSQRQLLTPLAQLSLTAPLLDVRLASARDSDNFELAKQSLLAAKSLQP